MGWSDDEKGKPLCAWAYNVAYFEVACARLSDSIVGTY